MKNTVRKAKALKIAKQAQVSKRRAKNPTVAAKAKSPAKIKMHTSRTTKARYIKKGKIKVVFKAEESTLSVPVPPPNKLHATPDFSKLPMPAMIPQIPPGEERPGPFCEVLVSDRRKERVTLYVKDVTQDLLERQADGSQRMVTRTHKEPVTGLKRTRNSALWVRVVHGNERHGDGFVYRNPHNHLLDAYPPGRLCFWTGGSKSGPAKVISSRSLAS